MKLNKKVLALLVMGFSGAASATSQDCGCTKTPTAYDKTQDVKISSNTSAIADVKLTADQAFDIAVEGRANIAKLQEQKLDKSVFTADQQRQDKALADAVSKQAETDAKQTSDLKSYADKKATSAYTESVAHTDAKVARADADRKAGDDALSKRIDTNAATQSERDAGQDTHINAVQDSAQAANEHADRLDVRADNIEKQAANLDTRVGGTEKRLDTVEGNVRETNDHLTVVDQRSQNNSVRLDGVEQKNTDQDTHINAVQSAAQTANDRAGNLEVRADKTEGAIRETNAQMESDRQQSIDRDAVNAGAITAESQARAEANVKLAAGISTAQSTGDYAVSRSDAALRNAATNEQAIRNTNAKVAEHSRALANHEQRLGELERNTSSRFADIDKRINENKRSANAGIAGVAAMANIPQVTGGARFSAGVGVGQRGSEQAIAVGFSSQLTDSVIGKVSVAGDSQQQWTVGAGLAVQW